MKQDLRLCRGLERPFLVLRRTSVVYVCHRAYRMLLSTGPILFHGHECGRDGTAEISCGRHEIFRLVKQSFRRRVFHSV